MSGFIFIVGGNRTNVIGTDAGGNTDQSIQEASYRNTEPYTSIGRQQDVDILWQRSSFPGQESAPNNIFDGMHQYWEWCFPPSGCCVRKVVSGTVVDVNGNAVSGATVQLFNTATGALVDTQTSQADGSYKVGDPNNVASFAVGYLSGSPDTTGATVDTLTGS